MTEKKYMLEVKLKGLDHFTILKRPIDRNLLTIIQILVDTYGSWEK